MKRLGTVDGEELILRKSGDVFKYYLNNKLIGVYDTNVMEDRILFREDSKENTLSAEIKDKVQNIVNKQNEEIFQEKEYRKEEVLELERQLGFSKKRNIKRITEIDLAQKVKINEEKTSKLERINNNILSKTENIFSVLDSILLFILSSLLVFSSFILTFCAKSISVILFIFLFLEKPNCLSSSKTSSFLYSFS